MKPEFTTDGLAQGVVAFVLTLRHTAGCTKEEVKHALHPKMIDMIFKIDDKRDAAKGAAKNENHLDTQGSLWRALDRMPRYGLGYLPSMLDSGEGERRWRLLNSCSAARCLRCAW